MGLFDRFKSGADCVHEPDWYLTNKAMIEFNCYENESSLRVAFLRNYLKTFPNLQAIQKSGNNYYVHALAKCLADMDRIIIRDKWGNETNNTWNGYYNLIDRTKNPFLDFIARLNHGLGNNPIIYNIIFTGFVKGWFKLDGEDSWLLDAEFWRDNSDHYNEFMNKLNSFENFHIEPSDIFNVVDKNDMF